MELTTFVRKPFKVEAVQITEDNIADIAVRIGRLLYQKVKGGGEEPYIQVDPRIIPNIPYVYLGFYMTEMGDNVRCYSERTFEQQFIPNSPAVEEWIAFLNKSASASKNGESKSPDAPDQNVAVETNDA